MQMQHYLYPAPLPPPMPISSGRGTILSQEARLHALQIAEEIQAERGSYRKWNEVAKAVNRQYGSNVDGDLVKRQVTSMLRSVQRSGLNSVKRPRKHAEVIQQLLDPVSAKRPCSSPGGPLRIRGSGEEDGEEGEGDRSVINVELDESDRGSNTGSESGSPNHPTVTDANAEKTDGTAATTTTTTTAADGTTVPSEAGATTEGSTTTPTKTNPAASATTPEGSTAKADLKKSGQTTPEAGADSHSIERVPRKKSEKMHQFQHHIPPPLMMQPPIAFAPPPPKVLPGMPVDEVYNLISRLIPDVDAEFIRTQEIDGNAFQTLSHKELTDFGVPTFGKRNKLLQFALSFDPQGVPIPPPPGNPDFFFGRLPTFSTTTPAAFIDAKTEGDKHDKEGSAEKKPPVTKVIDMEVVGVRKRYLVERENGGVEVLTPCKLRKYKHLTSAFEHIHPDKLVPIPTFSAPFTHVPNNSAAAAEDAANKTPAGTATVPTDPNAPTPPAAPPLPRTAKTAGSTKAAKSGSGSPKQGPAFSSPAYYPVYYQTNPYQVQNQGNGNLQWIPSPYPGVTAQRTPEKYHSFHPYTPPQPPK